MVNYSRAELSSKKTEKGTAAALDCIEEGALFGDAQGNIILETIASLQTAVSSLKTEIVSIIGMRIDPLFTSSRSELCC